MRSPARTIAIVGGGFCGTVLAAALLRRPPAQHCRLVLIERDEQVGRGVAYRCSHYRPLLNVPAMRMSADPGDPMQFARFAHDRDPGLAAEQFLPRELYGEYLQDLLRQSVQAAPAHMRFERVRAEATALHRIDRSGPYLVELSAARQLLADDVILACGDPPPADPACALNLAGHAAYRCDPYCDTALAADAGRLLLIGTALTMADVALAAAALNPAVEIHAISRHGLLPAAQSSAPLAGAATAAPDREFTSYLAAGPTSARALLRGFRALLRDFERSGADWRDAVNSARSAAPVIWQRMSAPERARFLRHLRVHWDRHRHRLPPAIDQRLGGLRRDGRLQIHAGHIVRIEDAGSVLRVRWRPRGTSTTREFAVDRVINCAGTDRRLAHTHDPLLRGLMASGLAQADPLGLGWRTAEHGALIDRDGVAASHLFYLGPMLRADHWEATAVGELRLHAQRLASALAQVRV
jgi:uncharacterized NAD(P)/FAD-binding protein YdhS